MTKVCTTEKELAAAIKSEADVIEIEIHLGEKIFRIKATGKTAWAVCASSLAIAIAAIIAMPGIMVVATPAGGGAAFAVSAAMVAPVATVLGPAAISAIGIGVCSGGIGALESLRDKYEIIERNEKYLVLKRK